jgi:adenylylsulfate kinase-like enzyme
MARRSNLQHQITQKALEFSRLSTDEVRAKLARGSGTSDVERKAARRVLSVRGESVIAAAPVAAE